MSTDLGFKPGNYGHVEELPTDAVLTLIRQLHKAKRAGSHTDLRLGGKGLMYSWALPHDLPTAPGEKRLGIQTPLHTYAYARQPHIEIPAGNYGAGTVDKLEESPVVILKSDPNHLVFTRGDSKDSPIYNMVRTKSGSWLVSIKEEGQPTKVLHYKKERFKSMPLDEVADMIDQGAQVRPKIDGASSLIYLGDKGIDVYGTRVGANGLRPRYTDIAGGLRNFPVPRELQGKLLRGEIYGVDNRGKPIHPTELTGILNSTLANAIDKKQKSGVRLLIAALAENKNGVDDYWTGADDIVAKLNHPAIHGLPPVTGEAAKRLVEKIRTGKYPLTREGVVLQLPGKRPTKSKAIDDFDVVIRDIFPADTKGEPRAGGFMYSYPGSDKIVGKIGTGMDHAMLKDMLANPQKYIGQTARVHSQEQLPSSALRAPGFIALKAD